MGMDIPVEFLHVHQYPKDIKVIIVLQGLLAKLLENVSPNLYQKYIIINSNGEKCLYV